MAKDPENFDISSLSYEEFLLYFFTSPSGGYWDQNMAGERYWLPEINKPIIIIEYITKMCLEFRELAQKIPIQTLDSGLDGMFAPAFFQLQTTLWSNAVPLGDRVRCIESIHRVYSDFVSSCTVEELPGSFYMWWDFICSSFWFDQAYHKKLPAENYDDLSTEDKILVDAMFRTLSQILSLTDGRTKSCALHGLGHLHHPGVAALVQQFIDSLPEEAKSPDQIKWLEECRDGVAM